MFCVNTDPPIVSIEPLQSPLIATVDELVFLRCIAHGYPLPKIQWYKSNVSIEQGSSEYYLVPTMSSHTAKYTCVASNSFGGISHNASASITVIIQGSS